MTRSFALLAAVTSLTASGTLVAQGATTGSAPFEPTPQITVKGVAVVTSMANWPGVSLSVNRDAYVTVFAVTRTKGAALPIQILSPAKPTDAGKLKAGRTVKPRQLRGAEALHLLNYGESPLIVAFASSVKPELAAFQAGGRWGHDLLMDTLATSEQQMIEILAKTIYAAGVPFDALISKPGTISPAPLASGAFAFGNGPDAESRYFIGGVNDPLMLSMLEPVVTTSNVYLLPSGYLSGAPFTLKGGSVVAVDKGRLVYLARPETPPTAAQRAGQPGAGSATTPPQVK